MKKAALFLILFGLGCGHDVAGPEPIAFRHVSLQAVSQTLFTAPVGSTFSGQPSVRVVDESGKPVAGVTVDFIASGGALIANVATGPGYLYQRAAVVSNADGIATLATLRISTEPGVNVVVASAGGAESVSFKVTALAGAPAILRMEAGDQQFIPALSSAVVRPTIKVLDSYQNPVEGVPFVFSVRSGGGTISGAAGVTDAKGLATVASWVVGPAGTQTLAVSVQGISREELFTASIVDSPRDCGVPATLPQGISVQAELSSVSCRAADGRYYDIVTVNLDRSTAYQFKVASPDFDTELELLGLYPLAANNDAPGSTDSEIKAILPAGTYKLRVSSHTAEKFGKYAVRFGTTSEVAENCEQVFISAGITTYQFSGSSDCHSAGTNSADRFRVYLRAGQTVKIVSEDLSYSDHAVVLMDAQGNQLALGKPEGGWWIMVATYAVISDGYYMFEVSSSDEGAEYMLTVR